MPTVFDYSAWRPDPRALKAAGIVGVSRYLTTGTSSFSKAKKIDKPEYDALLAAGLTVVLNWELDKGSWRGGYDVGRTHGAAARQQARALGHPDHRPIYQSVDTDWTDSELGVALDYQRGFNDGGGVGPQGMYGTCKMLNAAAFAGLIRFSWQTAAHSWNGNAGDCPEAHMIQLVSKSYPQFPSTAYDENKVMAVDWGQWPFMVPFPEPPLTEADALLAAQAMWS